MSRLTIQTIGVRRHFSMPTSPILVTYCKKVRKHLCTPTTYVIYISTNPKNTYFFIVVYSEA